MRKPVAAILAVLLLQAPVATSARDWYSAGLGDVDTRVFVVQASAAEVQALLPAELSLAADFTGKQPGRHPLIFLFSRVMPRKAHLVPIYIDMPYREFALFVPHVRHADLDGDFLHSLVLYLDSRMAVWIGQYPYRFPKTFASVDAGEGTRYGRFNVSVDGQPRLGFDYEIDAGKVDDASAELQFLDQWFSLPLINRRNNRYACAKMDWEIYNHASLARVTGQLGWQDDWLPDGRKLTALSEPLPGLRLQTRWFLSMPFACDRYRRPAPAP